MTTALLAIISVIGVSLVSLIGLLTISMDEARVRVMANVFISFAVGALLGDAFIHLIPEIFGSPAAPSAALGSSLLVLLGMMIFFGVEKLLRHHHGVIHDHHHPHQPISRPEVAAINILGDAIHNFIDGVVIGASYLASPALGLSTTFAVLLHEIPQEFGDFGILIHSGLSIRKAVLVNLASASAAIKPSGTHSGASVTSVERPGSEVRSSKSSSLGKRSLPGSWTPGLCGDRNGPSK